ESHDQPWMNTSAGSPLPYVRYCTCVPSGATAMCGVPSGDGPLASAVAAAGAGAAGATASCLLQATTRSAAISAETNFFIRRTLGERRGVVTDRERRREPRALDAEQVDEPGQAVIGGAFDAEVRLRFPGAVQLRTDAGVVGHQRAIREARPVAPDRIVEQRRARHVHGVVDVIDPVDVGTEAHA